MIKMVTISILAFFLLCTQSGAPAWSFYLLGGILILANLIIPIKYMSKPSTDNTKEENDMETESL